MGLPISTSLRWRRAVLGIGHVILRPSICGFRCDLISSTIAGLLTGRYVFTILAHELYQKRDQAMLQQEHSGLRCSVTASRDQLNAIGVFSDLH